MTSDATSPARIRYIEQCAERGIPVIEVSKKVQKECRGFGKIKTFPPRRKEYVDSDYREWVESE